MTMVVTPHEILFSTTDNVHSTHINAKDQATMKFINPITIWITWKQRCRLVFSNKTIHQVMLLHEIWSEVVSTLKRQHDDIMGRSKGTKR